MNISVFVMLPLLAAVSGCQTLPSCAWGKCAYPRTPALAPQMSERVYPLHYDVTYDAVRNHFERRGYPVRVSGDAIETEPYAEKPFAETLGLRYQWRVQIRKLDTLNTAVLPRLYVDEGNQVRELSPGLWPEPYRYFYHELEAQLGDLVAKQTQPQHSSSQ